jgi:peptidoglycan/LPS O-acetylase OafA/YrhL
MPATRYVVTMSWETLPALLVGLALPMLGVYRGVEVLPVVGVCLFALVMGVLLVVGRNCGLENLAGVAALVAAMTGSDGPMMRRVGRWGRGAYGIYLAHVLFLEGFFAVESARHLPITIPLKVMEFLGALGLSCGLVWVLNRSSKTRWLAGE